LIPVAYIREWRQSAPWTQDAQVEQDLIISRALIEIFSRPELAESLAFRGGTALFKFHLSQARYSEDIDLVQVRPGPIGSLMDEVQQALNPWLGKPRRNQSEGRIALIYRMQSEGGVPLRLKVEINSREHFSVFDLQKVEFRVNSRWFSGSASILTYHIDELLGTKMRALYQRKKGRDLFDLWKAFDTTNARPTRVVRCFLKYMEHEGRRVSRAEFEENLLLKLEDPRFLDDIGPLLAPDCIWDTESATDCILNRLAVLMPGEPWQGKRKKMKKAIS
jgi:predicted nucleotidyltransferase component of viral defense system